MKITEELLFVIAQFNPWWRNKVIPDLPSWHRGVLSELVGWIEKPPVQRAVLLSGARQVGKTTLLLQAIQKLLQSEVPPGNILYVPFNHPICKLAGIEAVLAAWRELEPKRDGLEYLFLDEAQYITNIGTWIKHQVDFFKTKRIIFTESTASPAHVDQESGVGRWHTIEIATLSFYEYLQIRRINLPSYIPTIASISALPTLSPSDRHKAIESTTFLIGHFHEYLVRGGFPQTTLIDSITQAQRLLREDIIDKVLKRDMTTLFGVRRIFELEQLFFFLCIHDGGVQDIQTISKELGVAKQTVHHFINLLESTYLIYKLPPFGYGKEVLRGRNKIYLSDPAIAPAVLIKGKSILENPNELSVCVETAVIGHIQSHCHMHQTHFSYWRSSKNKEIDFIVEINGIIAPFEVKYQSQAVQRRDIPGLVELTSKKPIITCSYVITKSPQDLGPLEGLPGCMKIPASLFCYWLGESEFHQRNLFV